MKKIILVALLLFLFSSVPGVNTYPAPRAIIVYNTTRKRKYNRKQRYTRFRRYRLYNVSNFVFVDL